MRKITVTRHGLVPKCWIILNMNEDEARKYIYRAIKKLPDQSKNVIPIKNRKPITIELSDNEVEIYAVFTPAFGLSQEAFSNKITIAEGCADKKYVLGIFAGLEKPALTLTEI